MNTPHPPAQFTCVPKEVHRKWQAELKQYGILYLYGLFGYGKTTQACHFADTQFKHWCYYSANDAGFLEDIETFLAARHPAKSRTLLILDDLQWVRTPEDRARLFAALLKQAQHHEYLQIMLLSRARLPEYLVPLRVTQRLAVDNQKDLLLDEGQIALLFGENKRFAALPVPQQQLCITHCIAHTHGCALWVQMYLQHICEHPNDPDTALALANQDIVYLLDHHILANWSPAQRTAFLQLSIFPSFTLDMATRLLGEDAVALIADFLQLDSLLQFEAPDCYRFQPEAHRYLSQKLETLPLAVRNQTYQIAATHYQAIRDFEQALRCYHRAGRIDQIVEIVIYLLENAEGCTFAALSEQYIDLLSPALEAQNPRIIGAKSMLAAYRMDPEESRYYLAKLKQLAEDAADSAQGANALSVYIRTLIASPSVRADDLKENLLMCSKYVQTHGVALKNIMPTGNFPSVLNGGLDLLPWAPYQLVLFPVMKQAVTITLGTEGVGAPDASLGELSYEQNKLVPAMASLTQALSDANFKGTIRVQYAITGIMARLLQSEGQLQAAQDILQNIREKANERYFLELLPNIDASLVHCALLRQDEATYTDWLEHHAPDEHATFYISSRFGLLTKARVYIALGRTLEALYILDRLIEYATLYHRPYLQIELQTLKAIVLYQRAEPWQIPLQNAVCQAQSYQLVRVFADQGAALLPLWKEMDWTSAPSVGTRYLASIAKALGQMAGYYPKYLQKPQRYIPLTSKEQAVLQLIAQGENNTQISQSLGINLGTAKFHVSNIMKKLHAENRTLAVKIAHEEGLI